MTRGLSRSLLATSVVALLVGHVAAAGRDSAAPVILQRFLALDDPTPTQFRALRHLEARNDKFEKSAWMDVWTEADATGFRYTVVCEDGSEYIRNKVLNANTWFYFHAERLGYWNRRQAYKSVQPLLPPMLQEIERLHCMREAREAATVTGRCKITLTEAAARLHRALETVAEPDDRSHCSEQSIAPTPATALQRLNGFFIAAIRSLLSGTNRSAG